MRTRPYLGGTESGHLSIVDRLLADPRVDPSDYDNYAIHGAASDGHLSVVERLLARILA